LFRNVEIQRKNHSTRRHAFSKPAAFPYNTDNDDEESEKKGNRQYNICDNSKISRLFGLELVNDRQEYDGCETDRRNRGTCQADWIVKYIRQMPFHNSSALLREDLYLQNN
jgi:hypothetical protein